MTPHIVESSATGAEIELIIRERLIPAVADLSQGQVLISLLSLQLCLMKPDLTPEELKAGVEQCSQFICLWLSELDTPEEGEKAQVN